jgi:hypothetical protein
VLGEPLSLLELLRSPLLLCLPLIALEASLEGRIVVQMDQDRNIRRETGLLTNLALKLVYLIVPGVKPSLIGITLRLSLGLNLGLHLRLLIRVLLGKLRLLLSPVLLNLLLRLLTLLHLLGNAVLHNCQRRPGIDRWRRSRLLLVHRRRSLRLARSRSLYQPEHRDLPSQRLTGRQSRCGFWPLKMTLHRLKPLRRRTRRVMHVRKNRIRRLNRRRSRLHLRHRRLSRSRLRLRIGLKRPRPRHGNIRRRGRLHRASRQRRRGLHLLRQLFEIRLLRPGLGRAGFQLPATLQ